VQVREPAGNLDVVAVKNQRYDVQFAYRGIGRLVARTQANTTVRFSYDTEEQLLAIHNEAQTPPTYRAGRSGVWRIVCGSVRETVAGRLWLSTTTA
jgi:YD repeat-containing protein